MRDHADLVAAKSPQNATQTWWRTPSNGLFKIQWVTEYVTQTWWRDHADLVAHPPILHADLLAPFTQTYWRKLRRLGGALYRTEHCRTSQNTLLQKRIRITEQGLLKIRMNFWALAASGLSPAEDGRNERSWTAFQPRFRGLIDKRDATISKSLVAPSWAAHPHQKTKGPAKAGTRDRERGPASTTRH